MFRMGDHGVGGPNLQAAQSRLTITRIQVYLTLAFPLLYLMNVVLAISPSSSQQSSTLLLSPIRINSFQPGQLHSSFS